MIIIDDRWIGNHGIGRYAREVISRLELDWRSVPFRGNPSGAMDLARGLATRSMTVHETLYSPGYNARLVKNRQILTLHDLIHLDKNTPGHAKYRLYYDAVLKPIIRRNRIVVTVSETSRQAISRWLKDDRVEIVNAGNGCSESFVPAGLAHHQKRPYFLYVGNTKAHKNLSTLLGAIHLLEDFDLIVVGADFASIASVTPEHVSTFNVSTRNNLTDDELAGLYRGAVATVMPSTLEGFGLPALESLSCGTPVIYWQGCDSVAEICRGAGGIGVSGPFDRYEWAAAMRDVASSSCVTTQPREEYSWGRVAALINDVLVP